jgi:hypothetical protein
VVLLLGSWRSHLQYQRFLVDKLKFFFKDNPNSFKNYESAILKMYYLNLDLVQDDFAAIFSSTGRPSNFQPEIFRSFVLMLHFKFASYEKWVAFASATPIICALVGVSSYDFPAPSTHRDFISRLWMASNPNRVRKPLLKPKVNTKLGKKKLPPRHPGIVAKFAGKALSGQVFKAIPEKLLQTIFTKTAVIPSANAGLLGDVNSLSASADGTSVLSHSSPYGHKICTCIGKCSCPRSFADPEARWGWDSYHEQWFFGYSAYILSVHNSDLSLDLPIYLKFVQASRHDSVSFVTAFAHARFLYKDLFQFHSIIADSAHDDYAIYNLLHRWNVKPFIALNHRSDNNLQVADLLLSHNGVPICADGYEMTNWGFDAKKFRIKYRCPLVTGRVKYCPYSQNCNKSSYGKIVYVRLASDLRLLTPTPRGSDEWNETYKRRTASERVNNRILTDYQLERNKRYGKKKLAFFAFWSSINVHLDVLIKFGTLSINDLVPNF